MGSKVLAFDHAIAGSSRLVPVIGAMIYLSSTNDSAKSLLDFEPYITNDVFRGYAKLALFDTPSINNTDDLSESKDDNVLNDGYIFSPPNTMILCEGMFT